MAELFHSQWEIEVGFRNLKSSLLNNPLVLRSRKVELLEQEAWGMLVVYNLIRREATKAAEKHKKSASEISFKFAFQFRGLRANGTKTYVNEIIRCLYLNLELSALLLKYPLAV